MQHLFKGIALAICTATPILAQDYPTGTVTMVVPYAPGGNNDVMIRQLAPYLEEKWGHPVIVDNRPGGGSMVGTAFVAQANPDGHTLLVNSSAHVTAPAIYPDLPFDPMTDLVPIANVGHVSYLLVTRADAGYESLDDFIKTSMESPKFAATAGLGTTTHFAMEKFIAQTGADVDVVHFKGGAPAVVAILSGEVDIYTASYSSSAEYLKNGQLKALAVIGPERIAAMPDVPSTLELGFPEVDTQQWIGIFGPKGIDPAIVAKISADVNAALNQPDLITFMERLDLTPRQSTPEAFLAQIATEMPAWKELAQQRGISAE